MKINDKVRSHFSLWKGDVGTIIGIIKDDKDEKNDWVHVIFPETEKHYAYQQSFYCRDLIIVK